MQKRRHKIELHMLSLVFYFIFVPDAKHIEAVVSYILQSWTVGIKYENNHALQAPYSVKNTLYSPSSQALYNAINIVFNHLLPHK